MEHIDITRRRPITSEKKPQMQMIWCEESFCGYHIVFWPLYYVLWKQAYTCGKKTMTNACDHLAVPRNGRLRELLFIASYD